MPTWQMLFLFGSKLGFTSAEYWIHFTARFSGVQGFGYNSAESEPIWMKSGALWVHYRGVGNWQILGAIHAVATATGKIFCQVSSAFPVVGQIPRNLSITRRSCHDENFRIRILTILL